MPVSSGDDETINVSPAFLPSDEDYRLMVESVVDYAIFMVDIDGTIRSWNSGARQIKGYDADEVIGRNIAMFYPPEQVAQRWPERELEIASKLGRFEDEGWRVRKDGTQFWASIIITRLVDEGGRLRGFSKITSDLTRRRQQAEQLRLSEERFRLLVDGVRDYAVFLLDPHGRVVSWNTGAQQTKGYGGAEVIGKHFSLFYPHEVAASGWPDQELRNALRDGRYEEEGWRIRKDGSRFWANVVITPLFDSGGSHFGFAKVTRDMTDQRRISALEDEGRRISTFLAMLGHELRNPLASISYALALINQASESPAMTRMHDILSRQLNQLTRLVDDLLDVGRITTGKIFLELKPVNVHQVLIDAVNAVEPAIQSQSHTLTIDSDGARPLWVNGDQVRLIQVVVNLLSNAAKYTPAGGRIAVSLHRVADKAEIRVADNGPGIASDLLPVIFDLFVQGDQDLSRSDGGLGLGLSLVHQLVTLHGGDIAAYSSGQPGKGSEFVVRLPIIDGY